MRQINCEKIGKKRTIKGGFRDSTLEPELRWQQQKNQPTEECYSDKLPPQNVHAMVTQEKRRDQKEQI